MAKGAKDFTANTSKLKQSIAQATEPIKEKAEPVADTVKAELDMSYLQQAVDIMAASIKQQFTKQRKPRKEYGKKEANMRIADGDTRGRKGLRMPRINMAFRMPVFEYIHVMAKYEDKTLTDFVNSVLEEHMEANKAKYQKAKRRQQAQERKAQEQTTSKQQEQ